MAKDRLTKVANINVTAREIDFVTRFADNWEHLREIMGIMRPIRKQPGAVLKSKKAVVQLQSGSVQEGNEIPYSQATVTETPYAEMTIEKYAKAVSIEAINTYGYDVAVEMTDDEFLNQLQHNVTGRFYTYIKGGELTNIQTTFQSALAMAKGLVVNKWQAMHKTATGVVGFVNVLDVYDYLGAAGITVQNQFGFEYIKDFMGFNTIFLLADTEIPRGKIVATPVENIVLYYVDPGDSDFARAGLDYTTDGETNLIGFHVQGRYETAVSESFAILGLTLFAEYIDGVAVVTIEASGSLGSITATSAAGTDSGTKITISDTIPAGSKVFYGSGASAPTANYKQTLDGTWKELTLKDGVADDLTVTGAKANFVVVNGSGQVTAASGSVTIVNKT